MPDPDVSPGGVQVLLSRVLKIVEGREVPTPVEGRGVPQEDVLLLAGFRRREGGGLAGGGGGKGWFNAQFKKTWGL